MNLFTNNKAIRVYTDKILSSSLDGSYIADVVKISGHVYVTCPLCGRQNTVFLNDIPTLSLPSGETYGNSLCHCDSEYMDENGKKGCGAPFVINLAYSAEVSVFKLVEADFEYDADPDPNAGFNN